MTAGSLTAAEPRAGRVGASRWAEALPLLSVTLQLALVILLVYQFKIESRTFFQISLLTGAGFVVHALLPLRFRLPFFVVLSLAAIGVAFGAGGGIWLVGVGLALIGICHLPIAFRWRVTLLLAAAAVLVVMRRELLPTPWPLSVWPILSSMFMFRLAVYLHSIRHNDAPVDLWRSLGYFFMFPNVCFPLFPVVDYQRFARDYYTEDPIATYQRGVRWIVRGLIQLLAYRFIYYNLVTGPAEVVDLGDFIRYALATFPGLFLKITGSYHLVVGMLLLFGFNLPEVTHRWLLSSSYTDFWRRMYTYWKDFMTKLVYYPLYFRLRQLDGRRRLALSLIGVFVATWLLHAWQYFWMRGDTSFSWPDTTFWVIMGGMVLWHSLREAGRRRTPARPGWRLGRALRINAAFWSVSLLITFWYGSSFAEWFSLLPVTLKASWSDLLLLAGLLLGGLLLAGWNWDAPDLAGRRSSLWYRYPAVQNCVTVVGLLVLIQPGVSRHFGPQAQEMVASLQRSTLNARDAQLLTRGYYENLENINRFNTEMWKVQGEKPVRWGGLLDTDMFRMTDDFLRGELVPSKSLVLDRQAVHTNRWGMRDQEYELAKPKGILRVALLGPSDVMGSWVGDGEPFEALLEERLNRENPPNGAYRRYEILNFGVPTYTLLQQAVQLEQKVLEFTPDVVILVHHPAKDYTIAMTHLATVVKQGRNIPSPELREIVRRAGVDSTMSMEVFARKLWPLRYETVDWAFRHVAELCRARGIRPVVLVMREPTEEVRGDEAGLKTAREAGFVVLDIREQVYRGWDETLLRATTYDLHPNQRAHRLIADRIFEEFRQQDAALRVFTRPDSTEARP